MLGSRFSRDSSSARIHAGAPLENKKGNILQPDYRDRSSMDGLPLGLGTHKGVVTDLQGTRAGVNTATCRKRRCGEEDYDATEKK